MPAWLHGPAYWAIRGVLGSILIPEVGPAVRAAAVMGRWFALLKGNRKRLGRAIDNLGVAFPDWSEERRREYAVKAYEHLFMLAVEASCTPRLLSEDSWSDHVRLGGMGDSVRHMLAGQVDRGRPCLLITGHCGNWELLGYTMALLGFPIHALYRPLDLAPLDRWVRQARERRGLVLLGKFGATEDLPRVMGEGGAVGFVADQNAGNRGLFVPFFGRLVSTYKTVGLLAMQFDAPIICGQARRLVWGRDELDGAAVGFQAWSGEAYRYTIDVTDIIKPEDWADRPDPLYYITARYRRAIEAAVLRAPEQYLWMHRYWKCRPRHERLGRPFPGALREKIEQLPWVTAADVERTIEWSKRDAAAHAAGAFARG